MLICGSYGASSALAFVRMLTIANKTVELVLSVLLPVAAVVWVFYHTYLKDARTVTNVDFNVRVVLNRKLQKKKVVIDYGLTRN